MAPGARLRIFDTQSSTGTVRGIWDRTSSVARTLYDKVWDSHAVREDADGVSVVYIDRHLVHEFTSPQGFDMLRTTGRLVRRPQLTLAVADNTVPTTPGGESVLDAEDRLLIDALHDNCRAFGVPLLGRQDPRRGIVHVVGPEQGFTQPGSTVACGDAHAATHGAFGALAFRIGATDVGSVLATQTLLQRRAPSMRIRVDGRLPAGCSAKDLVLSLVARVGAKGADGHVIEFAGPAVAALSMEGLMTLCNMSVETGALAGLVAPDDTTFAYLEGRPMAPKGADFDKAVAHWQTLPSDSEAVFAREIVHTADEVTPQVTWGTCPDRALPITGRVPDPAAVDDPTAGAAMRQELAYMDLQPGQPLEGVGVDRVFIGSCVNGRIEDLRAAAQIVAGRQVASGVRAMAVPGSALVKSAAEAEGLDRVFLDAGFEWRDPGCSLCIAMNGDALAPGERCVSTSNRNLENWQGRGGRTHLTGPAMAAAAAAVTGHLTDVRRFATGNR